MGDQDQFASILKNCRIQAGYRTAKSFYAYAHNYKSLSFNYSYYTRMERGSAVPSILIVQEIASLLPSTLGETLILGFCSQSFPDYRHLFAGSDKAISKEDQERKVGRGNQQTELTLKQISALSKQKEYYLLFLLLTIARKKVSMRDLKQLFDTDTLNSGLKILQAVKLISIDGDLVESTSDEFKFPDAYNQELADQYQDFRKWSRTLSKEFDFKEVRQKYFIRRTSSKFLSLIINLLNYSDELIKSSDEVDIRLNEEVFTLEYSLNVGRLPG